MAILSSDGKTVTVQKGDTLWDIAKKYCDDANAYKELATLNGIQNPDLIGIGDTIKLDGEPTSSTRQVGKATINQFGLLSTADNTLFATWSWDNALTESYKVQWTYNPGNGVWFVGENKTISVDEDDPVISRQDTYSIPNNAKQVRFKVKPISKTHASGHSQVNYWEASWSDVKTYTDGTPLQTPSTPTVEMDKLKLTASLDNITIPEATHIEFQVIRNNASSAFATKQSVITTAHASHTFTVTTGGEYKVRARAYNSSSKEYSDWSAYSNNVGTIPATPSGITAIRANSETSVYLEWAAADTATKYDIEYATKEEYFDGSDQTTVKSGVESTHYEVSGLEPGSMYYFRVRATNNSGESAWTELKSVVVGSKPAAPTTWSSSTTVIVGEPLTLYWVHNSEDGSSQTYADLELYVNGTKFVIPPIQNSEDEDEKDKTKSYVIDTSGYTEGFQIQWRVRTAGITKEYGEWSIQRTVDIYAPPTLLLNMTDVNGNQIDTLTSFPFYIYGLAGPKTQIPTGYHLSIVSNGIYETTDSVGNLKTVNVGDEVYSKYFDIQSELLVEMSANNVDLENNIEYTVICTVSMNSGLTTTASIPFKVTWVDAVYTPNASIGINADNLTATIRPYCEDIRYVYYKVNYLDDVYVQTSEDVGWMSGTVIRGARTDTGELVYSGTTAKGEEIYYCTAAETTPVTDVYLAVYRREFDGSFVELASGLDGARNTTVTDPHPALDLARYRVVATSKSTGAVSYYDLPGYPVGGKTIVIQWDEEWTNFEVNEDAPMEQPAWTGSLLKLPYNVDVSDNNKSDVVLVEYIGRSHPISYYGTQLGQSATWNAEIEKTDKETIYALRRLSKWMGDVYVREPSGSGYWANIAVSFNQKHRAVTIPVALTVTRVEGGA